MSIFDNYFAIDWSANSSPKTGAGSIWIAWLPKRCNVKMFNPRTRFEALKLIKRFPTHFEGAKCTHEGWILGLCNKWS